MKQTCDFCGEYLSDADENCPHCGAKNEHYQRTSRETPKTIEELRQWYINHNLPPAEVTRFFIGVDYKKPKAFGIYQDGNRFIVYKNKADGSRAIRYDGGDEAYAVNEIYLKLKEEIARQKANNGKPINVSSGNRSYKGKRKKLNKYDWSVIGVVVGILVLAGIFAALTPNRGYYRYNGHQYYYLEDWYIYDSGWKRTEVDSELNRNYSDYYESVYYDSDYHTSDFEDTTYYQTWQESQDDDDDWDSDSSWDSGDSWDSGGSDWDSDW